MTLSRDRIPGEASSRTENPNPSPAQENLCWCSASSAQIGSVATCSSWVSKSGYPRILEQKNSSVRLESQATRVPDHETRPCSIDIGRTQTIRNNGLTEGWRIVIAKSSGSIPPVAQLREVPVPLGLVRSLLTCTARYAEWNGPCVQRSERAGCAG